MARLTKIEKKVLASGKLGIRERDILSRCDVIEREYGFGHALVKFYTKPDVDGHRDGFVWDDATGRIVG